MTTGQPTSNNLFPVVDEVSLPRSPLMAVVSQIRFETILSVQHEDKVIPFQEAIRSIYPVFKKEEVQHAVLEANGKLAFSPQKTWNFSDLEEKWKVTLTSDSIAIETRMYSSRDEFLNRFNEVLAEFQQKFQPSIINRIGLRYINKLVGPAFSSVTDLIRPNLLGVLTTELPRDAYALSINETIFKINSERQLFGRWGLLPAHATIDPSMIKPDKQPSWILDIDGSNSVRLKWDTDHVRKELNELADNNYRFFRWAVTKEFLKYFGGAVE